MHTQYIFLYSICIWYTYFICISGHHICIADARRSRRQDYNDSNDDVTKRWKALCKARVSIVFCINAFANEIPAAKNEHETMRMRPSGHTIYHKLYIIQTVFSTLYIWSNSRAGCCWPMRIVYIEAERVLRGELVVVVNECERTTPHLRHNLGIRSFSLTLFHTLRVYRVRVRTT